MSVYVYCVLDRMNDAPTAHEEPAGIQMERPRILEIDEFGVVVSNFVGATLTPTKDNIFTHERVIESFMEGTTPLPFRFGTVVSEEKLREFVSRNRAAIAADLQKVRGCVEMGLKLIFRNTGDTDGAAASEAAGRGTLMTGTAFLKARQRRQTLQTEAAQWVNASVTGLIRGSDVSNVTGTAKLVVRIAHLVPAESVDEYKIRIDKLVHDRTNYAFLRSGPWPPYSFISAPRLS